jgi:hypothetical protein
MTVLHTHLLITPLAAQCAFFGSKTRAGIHISALFPFGKAIINEIARKSTGFRGVRWACIWDTPVAYSQREFYGKVDAKLEVKRLESDVQRTVAVSITYAAKMIAGRG